MNQDFKEFFELLNARGVEYVIIGGVAYNFHAPPRATKDIDVWVRPTPENLGTLVGVLADFGFPTEGLNVDELAGEQRVLMLGRAPWRIDVLTRPVGIDWDVARPRCESSTYEGVPTPLLGLEDLIRTKRAAGRPRDLADVASLEAIRRRRPAGPQERRD